MQYPYRPDIQEDYEQWLADRNPNQHTPSILSRQAIDIRHMHSNLVINHPFMATIQRIESDKQLRSTANSQGRRQTSDTAASTPEVWERNSVQFKLNQEVHLLDSDGSEKSGLTTYMIKSIIQPEKTQTPSVPVAACCLSPFLPPAPTPPLAAVKVGSNPTQSNGESGYQRSNQTTSQPPQSVYTLAPALHTQFRASHSRLLPVGFDLGAEVQQHDNFVSALVIRRTVRHGVRHYDLKDELDEVWKDVPEEGLTIHTGGDFGFRTIHGH